MSMTRTQSSPEVIDRLKAINLLRAAMLESIADGDADQSACRWASERGVFCQGFSRFDDVDLRKKFSWITQRRPKMSRQELEQVVDRWQLARQETADLPIACDVQQREHDLCRGWDDFNNEQLAGYLAEITGATLVVTP